ncbi:hypothetical protein OB905_11625 [Halobacteria archaeon AArc-dxtr1]|nr:hypothetical protein [Halobacteria archaeon AArc-dxtr1]
MSGRSIGNVVLVLVALAGLGVGVGVAAAPTLLPSELTATIEAAEQSVDPDHALLAVVAVVALFGLWRAYFSGATDVRDGGVEGAAEASDSKHVAVAGKRTTHRIDTTIDALKRGRSAGTREVIHEVRDVALAVETARGQSTERAAERVRRGEWTDDRIAAVFLGDESAGQLTLWHRLRAWLFPGSTFERRLERTVDELERATTDAATSQHAGTTDEHASRQRSEPAASAAERDGSGERSNA